MTGSVRKEIAFRGRVQGVGFRYTARSLARGFDVAGYVRNMPDGSVELVAEGPAEEVGQFVDALKARMASYIEGAREEDGEPAGRFRGFEVAF